MSASPTSAARLPASRTPAVRPPAQPDASRAPAGPARCLPDAMKPGIHGVRAHWIRGFMAFRLVRRIRAVMLMVSACPESGFPGARRPIAKPVLSWSCTMQHSCRTNVLAADRGKVSVAARACWQLTCTTKHARVGIASRRRMIDRVRSGSCPCWQPEPDDVDSGRDMDEVCVLARRTGP
jgi:hypothetical protein